MADDTPAVKANVVESNGEISCSIEETNRLRAALGLKPLRVDSGASKKTEPVNVAPKQLLSEENDIKSKIAKAKEDRLKAAADQKTSLAASASLGEALAAESMSAAQWVKLSRQTAKDAPQPPTKGKKKPFLPDLDELDRNLSGRSDAGMKISHAMDDFREGESFVLTLKDSTLLDEKGADLANEDDELENLDLTEQQKWSDIQERKRKANLPVYSGRDDDEFTNGANHTKKAILSHYDEEEDYKRRRKAALVITESGQVEDTAAAEKVRARLAQAAVDRQRINFDASQVGVQPDRTIQDYISPEELAAMRERAKATKKTKKLRKRVGAEEVADATAVGSSDIIKELQEQAVTSGSTQDRGSRAARRGDNAVATAVVTNNADGTAVTSVNITQETKQELEHLREQRKAFDAALSKAQAKSQAVLGGVASNNDIEMTDNGAATSVRNEHTGFIRSTIDVDAALANTKSSFSGQRVYSRLRDVVSAEDDGYDAELNAMLKRAKRVESLASIKQPQPTSSSASIRTSDVGSAVLETLQQAEAAKRQRQQGENHDEGPGLVFTDTSEFSNLLQSRIHDEKDDRNAAIEAASFADQQTSAFAANTAAATAAETGRKRKRAPSEDETNVRNVNESAKRARVTTAASDVSSWRQHTDMDGNVDNEDEDAAAHDSEANDEEESAHAGGDGGFTGEEPTVSKGLAGALAMLSKSGVLSQKEKYRGRATDHRSQDYDKPVEDNAGHTIVLEYKDEFGRKLTQKQAFRELSYKFHGQKPSQKQRDKMIRREKRERLQETSAAGMAVVQAVSKVAEATGSAYIALGK